MSDTNNIIDISEEGLIPCLKNARLAIQLIREAKSILQYPSPPDGYKRFGEWKKKVSSLDI